MPSLAGRLAGDPEVTATHVDAVLGSDANPGTRARPLATLAAAAAVGNRIRLRRGRKWREAMPALPAGSCVDAYGLGPRPIIDGSESVPPEDLQPVGNGTWSLEWRADYDAAGGKAAHRLWEDGVRMLRAVDAADCAAHPGSFWAPVPTGGLDVLLIHPSSGDPWNHSYEATQRLHCVAQRTGNCTVRDLHLRRNGHADGSLVLDGLAERCLMEDGRIHNALLRGRAVDCVAWKCEPGTTIGGAIMFVTYGTVGDGFADAAARPNVEYIRCSALAEPGAVNTLGSEHQHLTLGFSGHTGGPERFGTAVYEECTAENCLTAYAFQHVQSAVVRNCTASGGRFGVVVYADDLLVEGGDYSTTAVTGGLLVYDADFELPRSITLRGAAWRAAGPNGDSYPVWVNVAGCATTVEDCRLEVANGGTIWLAAGSFAWNHNTVWGGNWNLRVQTTAGFAADHNSYHRTGGPPAFQLQPPALPPENYIGLPAWRTATGQESNSVELPEAPA